MNDSNFPPQQQPEPKTMDDAYYRLIGEQQPAPTAEQTILATGWACLHVADNRWESLIWVDKKPESRLSKGWEWRKVAVIPAPSPAQEKPVEGKCTCPDANSFGHEPGCPQLVISGIVRQATEAAWQDVRERIISFDSFHAALAPHIQRALATASPSDDTKIAGTLRYARAIIAEHMEIMGFTKSVNTSLWLRSKDVIAAIDAATSSPSVTPEEK